MQASSHLIIIDDSSCDQTNAEQLSNPNILNYYRQLLIKGYMADILFDFAQGIIIYDLIWTKLVNVKSWRNIHLWPTFEGRIVPSFVKFWDRQLYNMIIVLKFRQVDPGNRVYSGVSAILDFQILNFRPYACHMETWNSNCRIFEFFLTVDTSRKMQNGVTIDDSIDRFNHKWYCIQKLRSNIVF